jgi:hypothetical protein
VTCNDPNLVPATTHPAWEIANAYLACLCDELATTVAGSPCRCCIYPGPFPPVADYCDSSCSGGNGQAVVQIISRQPTPQRNPRGFAPCAVEMQVVLQATVYRCGATPDEYGRFPSCERLQSDAAVTLDDEAAMRRAACCVAQDAMAGIWQPVAVLGGCIGGTLTITIPESACI